MTGRRDRTMEGMPKEYLHVKKTISDARSKAARFNEPITVTKETLFTVADNIERKPYMRVHVPFQSTSSTNISTVNAIKLKQDFRCQERARQDLSKRKWGIKMNKGQQLYLKTYGRIDTIDSLISHCHTYYRSWKY